MNLEEIYYSQQTLFKKIYEPEYFEQRMIGWLKNVQYLTDLYSTRKKNIFRIILIIKIFYHFTFRVPPRVRNMFWNVLKAAGKINPRLISKAVSSLLQYWHYYEFRHSSWRTQHPTVQDGKRVYLG